ncbi:MAG TPA: pyrimidine 5'-nucleotidase [Stellaceae bacterium]|nr:pyrimidine 5'-nucleotidase [Stellaceae bacterium]
MTSSNHPHPPALRAGSPLSRNAGEGAERGEAGEGDSAAKHSFAPITSAKEPVPQDRHWRPLSKVETWIFDLDNTLYPASCRLFDQIHARMTEFIAGRLGLSPEQALFVQKTYFREHGTTLRGLMVVDGIDPDEFMDFVHAVDLACVPPDPALVTALCRLPGRKIVHTNGSQRHAERLLGHLGIAESFCGIIDIAAAGYDPKPALAGYHELVRRHGVAPAAALMIDDIARNLVPAAALGMTTAWLRHDAEWSSDGAAGDHIHYVVDDLAGFLAGVLP